MDVVRLCGHLEFMSALVVASIFPAKRLGIRSNKRHFFVDPDVRKYLLTTRGNWGICDEQKDRWRLIVQKEFDLLELSMELTHRDLETLANLVAKEIEAIISARSLPGRWLTLREAMRYAKVKSPNTIKKWIDDGLIYAFKRSGKWIVDRESIDDWYNSEKVG